VIYDVGRWQVLKEDSEKHYELWKKGLEMQKANRDLWCYKESRFFRMIDDDGSVENWMWLDSYESKEDYDRFMAAFPERMKSDPELKASYERFQAVMVPDSTKMALWKEVEEFRVE
jgi:hypothetical protein